MRLRLLFLFVLAAAFAAPLASAGITYQPDALPEVGFTYDPGEYLFRLTYRGYYLNIQPYAVYDNQTYTLKQIVPFLKSHYPDVSYRQAVQIFARYHRWGFWLERLPPEVSAGLSELGYRLVDTNIPRGWFEVEADPLLNVSRVTVGGRFTLDFSDLEARYSVAIDAEGVHVTGVSGLADLDMDPITYSAPTITVTGTNAGAPWTFLDIYNADVAGGWGVVANNNGTGRQFIINAVLTLGDGSTVTLFADTLKQVIFGAAIRNPINVLNKASLTLGTVVDVTDRTTSQGCEIGTIQTIGWGELIDVDYGGAAYLYSCSFWSSSMEARLWSDYAAGSRLWNCVGKRNVVPFWRNDIYNWQTYSCWIGVATQFMVEGPWNDITAFDGTYGVRMSHGAGGNSFILTDIVTRNFVYDLLVASLSNLKAYLVDCDLDDWGILFDTVNNATIYRQYTFNLNVTGSAGAPIAGANVTLTRADGTAAFTATTYPNGTIPEQTVTRGYYTQATGDTLNDYGPFTLTVEADGYLPYEMVNINVNYPVNWSISLTALNLGLERVAVLALASLFYIAFVTQAWQGEFLRSLVYGAVSTVGWLITAAYWWTGGFAVASVTTFFLGIGAVNLVQLLYALFNYMGMELAEQAGEWWDR